ncbi:hypothetical protein PPL_09397 [Heterostelium album PN500]|uniref:2'-phosphotransferase n=1 Tax=Heterostelium pallidum (strain ATCC 26659 / Pp 5 / PN500) TaxID=670386 RepID=D3BLG3_HETP5|nr:hypothetical protein PPL_09397 [Heterostelium album PN500]EFA77897.1 hypothetical protein PPL_09397 [Heterostelium album PN500]|eukprot:XP_020430025.1 hypothetical protein PPL_09397 [Heterostelium album PN500]
MSKGDVAISKTLSYLLRHGAVKEGLTISNDGFVKVNDVLNHKQMRGVTLEKLREIVDTNDKKRYHLEEIGGVLNIRANQGHTLKHVDDVDLKKIESVNDVPSVIHGTYRKHLESIKSKGLNKMDRNHIHFATGDHGDVVSGMRGNCELVIHINLQKALDDGIPFFLSKNGVVLCAGDKNGYLSPIYFSSITDRRGNPVN